MAQAAWRTTKRPKHLTTRQPKKARKPSNVSMSGVIWTTFGMTVFSFVFLT